MELTPAQVEEIRRLLNLFCSDYIELLRKKPFRDPSKSIPSDSNGPEEAGRTEITPKKSHWFAAIIIELLALILLTLEIESKGAGAALPPWLAVLVRGLSASDNLLIAITALILVVIPALLLLVKVPVHEPDLLFARLLSAKVKSKYPISDAVIADLLSDRRFRDIFDRAVELTLPLPRGAAVDRLLDALEEDPGFVQLYSDRGGNSAPEKAEDIDPAIRKFFGNTARKLLFDNILDDPDFLYLYDDIVHRRNAIARWLSKIQWEKAKDVFGKSEEKKASPKGADALGIVNVIALFVIAWAAFFGRFLGGSSLGGTDAKCQDEACAKVIAELPKVIKAAVQPDRQSCVPMVHVDVRPPSITLPPVEVKGPAVTVQPMMPDKSQVGTTASPSVEVNVAPNQYSSHDRGDQQKGKAADGGDHHKRELPQEADDTFVVFKNKSPQDIKLRKGRGVICSFSAHVEEWPPRYPVEIKLTKTGGTQCILEETFTAFAEPHPTYSGSLGAYLSVDEEYKRTPFLIWKTRKNDRLIVRVHQQEEP